MRKKVLGLNVWHDRGACIVEDGRVKVAIAQERIDRRKHSEDRTHIPIEAIEYCCEVNGGDRIDDFDAIVITTPERPIAVMPDWIEQLKKLGLKDGNKVYTLSHQLSHAYAAYFPSSFEKALIWVADGCGSAIGEKREAESAYIAHGLEITPVWHRYQDSSGDKPKTFKGNPQLSLGRKYEDLTYKLGFRFGQAGKTMALAAFGDVNRFADKPLGELDDAGNLHLDKKTFMPEVEKLLETEPLPNFHDNSVEVKGWWADAAAHYQKFLEDTEVHFIETLMQKHEQENLCMAGGVALNCVANSVIVDNPNIKDFYIQPAASDDGQALGAALYGYYSILKGKERHQSGHTFLGRKHSSDEIISELKNKVGLSWKVHENIEEVVAKEIAQGKIVGWFQGGSEYGPRALGHRSILADPSNPTMKDIVNTRVKHREMFRPFAAAVVEDEVQTFFEFSGKSPYMLLAINLKESYREKLHSIIHIDGSSRIQTVDRKTNKRFYKLLKKVKRLTGFPILLNTSFNVAGQPIVESPEDAIETFQKEDIDLLVLDNILVKKQGEAK